jgi:prolyl-tRNA synthetase
MGKYVNLVDVILDDRDARPGVMFAEWELIGVPLRVTVGDRGLADGVVELQGRRDAEAAKISVDSALKEILDKLETL